MTYIDRNGHASCQKKEAKEIFISISIVIFLSLIACSTSYAFGIATPYIDNDTLKLEPGQSYTYTITLQNNDDVNYYVDLNYTSDENVATLQEFSHIVPFKSYDTKVSFEIKIPEKAFPGDMYYLIYSARPILNISGQVGMTVEIRRTLKIQVVESEGQGYKITFADRTARIWHELFDKTKTGIYYIAGVIAVIIMIFVIIRFWSLSKGISRKITEHHISRHAKHQEPHAPFPISRAQNTHDILELLIDMPNEEFDLEEIRMMFSKRLVELNETYLSKKILTIKSKKKIIEMLKE